jgi:hypothetical protein
MQVVLDVPCTDILLYLVMVALLLCCCGSEKVTISDLLEVMCSWILVGGPGSAGKEKYEGQ